MLWEIDGHTVQVDLKDLSEIQVYAWTATDKSLAVPVGMPQEEALWAIRQLIKTGAPAMEVYFDELALFGRSYTLKITRNAMLQPYLQGSVVHCAAKRLPLSLAARKALAETLLLQQLSQFVGHWEEKLHLLVQTIEIRKFKTKAFTICLDSKVLVFSKSLLDKPLEWINYTTLYALLAFTNWDQETKNNFIKTQFPLWKIYHKSLAYEYRNSF